MINRPEIIIVTLLPAQGTTGVQTHFNQIIKVAQAEGYATRLVHPYELNWFVRKSTGLVGKLLRLISKEYVELWARFSHFQILKFKLKKILSSKSQRFVIYAQDPLSAKAALRSRNNTDTQKVLTVIHFNISEADEYLVKGITKKNSWLFNHLVNTEKNTLPNVDKSIFVSQFMCNVVQERLAITKKTPHIVIPNFIEDTTDSLKKSDSIKDIITIGTLESRKNQAFILHVLAACNARGKFYTLTIIGDGPDRLALEELSKDLNLTDQITFMGFIPDAIQYIKSHKIYAHAALLENMPLTLMEALSKNVPIISAPVGGIPEIYSDGKEGLYWPLNDVEKAADNLIKLLENKSLYAEMAKNARICYEQNFSKESLAHKWLNNLVS